MAFTNSILFFQIAWIFLLLFLLSLTGCYRRQLLTIGPWTIISLWLGLIWVYK